MEVKWYSLNEAYKRYHKTNNHWSHWHKIHINKENIECLCDIIDTQYVFKYLNGKLKDVLFTNENVIKELLGNKFITPIEYVLSLDEVLSKTPLDYSITNDNDKEVEKVDPIFEVLKNVRNAFKELIEENKKLRNELIRYKSNNPFKPLLFREFTNKYLPTKDKETLGGTLLMRLLRNEGVLTVDNVPFPFYSRYFNVINRYVGKEKNIPSTTTLINELGCEFLQILLKEKGYIITN